MSSSRYITILDSLLYSHDRFNIPVAFLPVISPLRFGLEVKLEVRLTRSQFFFSFLPEIIVFKQCQ